MLVVVGSTSQVKIEATRCAFENFFDDVEVKGVDVPSGVRPFPLSDEEALSGALNRATQSSEVEPRADYNVGRAMLRSWLTSSKRSETRLS